MSELNTQVNMTIQAGPVANTPIDDTLEIEGAAADAKAVGDALALKADKSELPRSISVNGESPDNDGQIVIDAGDIRMGGTSQDTVAEKISQALGRPGTEIPLGSAGSAQSGSVTEAIADLQNRTGAQIYLGMSTSGDGTIAGEYQRLENIVGNSLSIAAPMPVYTEEEKSLFRQQIDAASISALSGKLGFSQLASISGNGNRTYGTTSSDTKAILLTFGTGAGLKGVFLVNTANGSTTVKDISDASSLSVTTSGSSFTITNSASNGARVYAVVFAGSVSDET